ncbi:transcriptional regulator, XRE family [Pseudogulbenkiania sp. NH8B]|nr:transcriptional regulator, XRE family [Pseudogulbenkiania sp. NH8B]
MHNIIFGRTLRNLRLQRKLSQEKLAFEAELDRTCISLLELGYRSPKLDTLVALSRGLNMSASEFFLAIATGIESTLSKYQK